MFVNILINLFGKRFGCLIHLNVSKIYHHRTMVACFVDQRELTIDLDGIGECKIRIKSTRREDLFGRGPIYIYGAYIVKSSKKYLRSNTYLSIVADSQPYAVIDLNKKIFQNWVWA